MESCNVLLRKRQEDADKDRQVNQLQGQLEEKQGLLHQLQQQIKGKDQEISEMKRLRGQIGEL